MAQQGRYATWSAIFAGLKTISTGGGYWNTFSSANVLGVLVRPDEQAELPAKYLCLPLADEEEEFTEQERGACSESSQTVFAFVRDTADSDFSTAAIESILKVRDDLVRYFLLNPSLGGAVDAVMLVGSGVTAGHGREHRYGELQLFLKVRQYLDSGVLGSGA